MKSTPFISLRNQQRRANESLPQNTEASGEITRTAEEIREVFRREPFDSNAFFNQMKRWRQAGLDGNANPLMRRLFAMLMQNADVLSPRRKIEEGSRAKTLLNADQLVGEITHKFTTSARK